MKPYHLNIDANENLSIPLVDMNTVTTPLQHIKNCEEADNALTLCQ